MPLRAPAPLPPLREATGEPRELGFRIKPKARPVRRIQDLPPWAQKVLIGVGVVAFYFAARALNRFRVSFGARDVAIEALIPLLGVDAAQKEAARQHGACFDKAYRTGWVKWQDYSFDERKHADCVMRGVMADFQQRTRDAAAAARKAEAARQPPVVASATTPRPPPPPPTPPPILSRVAVGNIQVLRMARSPQIGGRVSFDLSLGQGLGKLSGRIFRIGHLGWFNDLMLCGTLAGVEMALAAAGVPHRKGGVDAAMASLSSPAPAAAPLERAA